MYIHQNFQCLAKNRIGHCPEEAIRLGRHRVIMKYIGTAYYIRRQVHTSLRLCIKQINST